jgi:hypothetical protein
MSNYCLYWAAGSCGDIVQWIFSRNKVNTIIKETEIDYNGKINFVANENIKQALPLTTFNQFYVRSWNVQELKLLMSASPFLIGTHLLEQIDFISAQIPVKTIGITYGEQHFETILKMWIKKVGQYDQTLCEKLSIHDKILIDKFKSRELYQQYLFKKFTSVIDHLYIPKSVTYAFDISIPFDVIAAGDLDQILTLLEFSLEPDNVDFFKEWYSKQEF